MMNELIRRQHLSARISTHTEIVLIEFSMIGILFFTSTRHFQQLSALTLLIIALALSPRPSRPRSLVVPIHLIPLALKYNYRTMKAKSIFVSVAAIASSSLTLAQDYQDYADGYEQDDLYQNYATKQQEKAVGGGLVFFELFCLSS